MKRTFFYSEQQKKFYDKLYPDLFITGKEFTEQVGTEGDHFSNWEDAVIVHVQHGLKRDNFTSKEFGYDIA